MNARAAGAAAVSETGDVVGLSHDGAGIVRAGKAALVPGALPGERIRFHRARRHRQHDEARLEAVLTASAARVVPRCAHFDICGGCALQHLDGEAQLALKQQQLAETLERLARLAPQRWLDPIRSPPWGYRRRARLGVRYVTRKGRVLVGFRERGSNLIACLERCEVLAAPIGELLVPLATLIDRLSIREQLPQIEVAASETATALVLRVLAGPSPEDRERLREFERRHGVHLFLQSGGPDSVLALTPPAPRLSYRLPAAALELEFGPTDFVQVNAEVNRALVARAVELLEPDADAQVLDLFCGIGNFSLALARAAQRVIGIEGDSALIDRARANARANDIGNAQFQRADLTAPDLASAAWWREPCSHLLLDPPRAGARALLEPIARLAPRRLLYISCDPGTLARDLGVLVHEHKFELLAAGVVDMFAHTAHIESIALLRPAADPRAAGTRVGRGSGDRA